MLDQYWLSQSGSQTAREFPSGANRSDDSGKPNYIGYLSPLVIERFGRYMLAHQYGGQRTADNWKKGIPRQAYLESMAKHGEEIPNEKDVMISLNKVELSI